MKANNFKPCPWCNTTEYLRFVTSEELYPGNYFLDDIAVICDHDEGGCGAVSGFGSGTENEAIEKWNGQGLSVDWIGDDEKASMEEGWGLSNGPNDSWREIQRIDEMEVFYDDVQALLYVVRRAEEGSRLHQRALFKSVASWQGNRRGSVCDKPYTVILIYPDYAADQYGEDFYIGYSSASSPEQAVEQVQREAFNKSGCDRISDDDHEDFALIACFQNELHPLLYNGGGTNI